VWSTPRPGRFSPGEGIRNPLYRRLGGLQGRYKRVQKISPQWDSTDRPARTESLYLLRYPGPKQQQQQQQQQQYDKVCTQLHFNICGEIGVNFNNEHWDDHVPKSVETSREGNVTILRNKQVQTDRTVLNDKSDGIIHDNEKGTCRQLYTISGYRNVIKKEAGKILNYNDLTM